MGNCGIKKQISFGAENGDGRMIGTCYAQKKLYAQKMEGWEECFNSLELGDIATSEEKREATNLSRSNYPGVVSLNKLDLAGYKGLPLHIGRG
jgi:hypothetical protein